MKYIKARSSSKKSSSVLYIADDGSRIIRSGGSRAWRNNNPGNMRYTDISRRHGAIGSAGGFAVFPDKSSGIAALSALLHGQSYITLSIYSAIKKYAPPKENDTDGYLKQIARLTGLDTNKTLSELNDVEFQSVINAIQVIEGYAKGTEKSVRKVIGVKTNGKHLTAFLIEGHAAYISKSDAINLADEEEIDAVVVRPAGGEAYLRASADGLPGNNFNAIAHAEG